MRRPFTLQLKAQALKKILINSQFSVYFLLPFPFLPFRLFYTVQSYELQMLEVFTHSFPQAERFALNMENLRAPRPDQP